MCGQGLNLQPLSSGRTTQRRENKRSSSHLLKWKYIIHMSCSHQATDSLQFATQRMTVTWQLELLSCWCLGEVAESWKPPTAVCVSPPEFVMMMMIIDGCVRVIITPDGFDHEFMVTFAGFQLACLSLGNEVRGLLSVVTCLWLTLHHYIDLLTLPTWSRSTCFTPKSLNHEARWRTTLSRRHFTFRRRARLFNSDI